MKFESALICTIYAYYYFRVLTKTQYIDPKIHTKRYNLWGCVMIAQHLKKNILILEPGHFINLKLGLSMTFVSTTNDPF